MNTDEKDSYAETVETVLGIIFALVILGAAVLCLLFAYDNGQLSGYCTAKGGTVEDSVCVNGDTILKRGSDI